MVSRFIARAGRCRRIASERLFNIESQCEFVAGLKILLPDQGSVPLCNLFDRCVELRRNFGKRVAVANAIGHRSNSFIVLGRNPLGSMMPEGDASGLKIAKACPMERGFFGDKPFQRANFETLTPCFLRLTTGYHQA